MKKVQVADIGSASKFTVDRRGCVIVEDSGGVDIIRVLHGSAFGGYSAQDLADIVLRCWMANYDGDPVENRLTVEVNGVFAIAS